MSEHDVEDLRIRLARTRWPESQPEEGWSRGMPRDELRALVDYWRDEYDWRGQESRLNAYPQFIASIDGQAIHFLHVTSGRRGATPLLLTHGFPSSLVEFTAMIEPLVNPTSGPAFHP